MTRCERCGVETTVWMLDGRQRALCLDCWQADHDCTAAIVTIRRYADSVHAGGIVARLEEVRERADAV